MSIINYILLNNRVEYALLCLHGARRCVRGSLKCFEWVLKDIHQNTEEEFYFLFCGGGGRGGRPNTTRHADSRLAMCGRNRRSV